jgi:prepilin-type N-terminal cleavage/methylation domain-containing protein
MQYLIKKNIKKSAFSLIEISVVILIIGILISGVSQGIDWFFTKVNVGIIIEDDLVLHAELLSYAELCEKFLSMPKA